MGNPIDPKESTIVRSQILGQMLGYPAGAIGLLHTFAQAPAALSLTGIFAIGLTIKCSADFAVYTLSDDRRKKVSDRGIVQGVIAGSVMGATLIGSVALGEYFGKSVYSGVKGYVVGDAMMNTVVTSSTQPPVCAMPLDAPALSCGK